MGKESNSYVGQSYEVASPQLNGALLNLKKVCTPCTSCKKNSQSSIERIIEKNVRKLNNFADKSLGNNLFMNACTIFTCTAKIHS